MTTAGADDLDRNLKELERDKREEELRQLKANARVRWVTPTAIAALLPLAAGFGLWVVKEVKQYGAGYRALEEVEALRKEKEALERQKNGLNVEIGTLLQLKQHYAEQASQLRVDVEAKQEAVDKAYLRAVFYGSEMVYTLDHVGPPPADDKGMDALRAEAKSLPNGAAEKLSAVLGRYRDMEVVIKMARDSSVAYNKAINLLPASAWAKQLDPMPTGSVISNRQVMLSGPPGERRFYDVKEGRFLTRDETKDVKGGP